MSFNRISVAKRRRDTVIRVQPWPEPDAAYYVVSSNVCDPPLLDDWPKPLQEAIADRRRDRGSNKGRILYAFQRRVLFQQDLAVGALLYHLEDQVLRVTRLGVVDFKVGTDRYLIQVRLLECAQEMAGLSGAQCLEWIVRDAAAARSVRQQFEFRRVPLSDRRYRDLRSVILMERC